MIESMKKLKSWEKFLIENENNFLPLDSLEWEFWNQSRSKIHKDPEIEFQKHKDLLMNNISNISKRENIPTEKIIDHLKKFWYESIREEYLDMRKNRKRFVDFRSKTDI